MEWIRPEPKQGKGNRSEITTTTRMGSSLFLFSYDYTGLLLLGVEGELRRIRSDLTLLSFASFYFLSIQMWYLLL